MDNISMSDSVATLDFSPSHICNCLGLLREVTFLLERSSPGKLGKRSLFDCNERLKYWRLYTSRPLRRTVIPSPRYTWHAIVHLSGLARITPKLFAFCHFGGSFRPSTAVELPQPVPIEYLDHQFPAHAHFGSSLKCTLLEQTQRRPEFHLSSGFPGFPASLSQHTWIEKR
ncbi:uncharacterized protein M421DRAFT_174183 [Didymella exigua CBS 183.55]|uniref:Uncharacterized protein n=1 Tax=Didymella exigua CBS 183.55 TaxID=1150837 RepID=A0A6A5RJV0_9PLEO|nr:uncharacterized protein M421DRAFT_174183 [Didymella exigua CBS 183.55]KAF1927733.1 hypothetical protein M421DRAFT_174183 [Didymella exigua CBS 183.55]